MFEKEAKERARKLEENQTVGVYDSDEDYARDSGWNNGEVAGYEEGFKDGAEFGYNKCDEQLIKAKELLEKLLEEEKNNMYWEMNGSDKSSYYEVRKQAEQFLNSEVALKAHSILNNMIAK